MCPYLTGRHTPENEYTLSSNLLHNLPSGRECVRITQNTEGQICTSGCKLTDKEDIEFLCNVINGNSGTYSSKSDPEVVKLLSLW